MSSFSSDLPILDAEIVTIDLDAIQDGFPKPTPKRELVAYTAPAQPFPALTHGIPRRGLLRRAIDDPYWILMTLTAGLGLAITGTVIYGIVQICITVLDAITTYGPPVLRGAAAIGLVLVLLALCGGGAAKCAGLHCGGCKR